MTNYMISLVSINTHLVKNTTTYSNTILSWHYTLLLMLFEKGLIEGVNILNKIWQENMLEKDAHLFNCVRLYYFPVFVDEAPKNGIATYFLHIIEGLSLDLTFTDLNQFLEF